MKFRGFWLNVALVPVLGAASIWGCSAPDPGLVTFSSAPGRPGRGAGGPGGPGGNPGGGPGVDEAGAPVTDGGSGTETSAGPPNAFTGAPPYTTVIAGGDTLNANHNFAGATPTTNPLTQACLDCHGPAGGASTKFAFGGSVFKDTAGTIPAPSVEIRVRDSAGTAMVTHSDVNGNFYAAIAGGGPQPITANSLAGARDNAGNLGAMTPAMTKPTDGSCGGGGTCHGGTAGKVHVP